MKIKMKNIIIASIVAVAIVFTSMLGAKVLLDGEKIKESNSSYTIRTDGLACYFCAYGLERFFKKTGKIYSMDIDMIKGLVIIKFVKSQHIPDAKELFSYVHDAGFTPRFIKVQLTGTFSKNLQRFVISENNQSFKFMTDKIDKFPKSVVSIEAKLNKENTLIIEKIKSKEEF